MESNQIHKFNREDYQFQSSLSNSTMNNNSSREVFGQKAINLSSKLITKSANYLSSKNLESLANPLNRVNRSVLQSSSNPTIRSRHSKNKSDGSWQEWDHQTSNWNMKVGGQPVPDQNFSTSSDYSSINYNRNHSTTDSPSFRPLSSLNLQNWQKKLKDTSYSENHLVCFPGFAALRSPSYSRAGDIEVFVSIYAFRTKPSLDHLNRSQKLIHSMICKITGLPPLPLKRITAPCESNPEHTTLIEDDWIGSDYEQTGKIQALVPTDPSPNHLHPSLSSPSSDDKLKFSQMPSVPHLNTQLSTPSTKITCTAPTPVESHPPSLPPRPTFSRSSSASSSKSLRLFYENQSSLNDSNVILVSNSEILNRQFSIANEDLSILHFNLKERLHSFFSQSSENFQVRLKIYGICSSKLSNADVSTKKSTFRSRIEQLESSTPELDQDEFILNNGRPLLTQVVTTRAGGVWDDKLVLPWQTIETHLSVNRMQTESKLAGHPLQSRLPFSKNYPQATVIRLRIDAELINAEIPNDLSQKSSVLLLGQSFESDVVNRKLSVGKPTFSMELDVIPALAESIHVISDIDDTIKHTNVLGGLKYVFQHVFLAEFEKVAVTGMAEWYQSLRELGCWIHYISNSPLELWYCVEGFLAKAGFPRGSVSLKEYARGATSILSGMLESAGSRKRARVEAIIKRFPNSRFICIGDSGEQDLEMYVSLAQAYPSRIISIYIRDVTSPAILGREISIENFLSLNHPLSSSDLNGSQLRRTSRFGMPSSLVGQVATAANVFSQQTTNRSWSHDASYDSNLSHADPSTRTSVNKPTVPPKPSHLSSKRLSRLNPAAGATNLHRTRNESYQSLGPDLNTSLTGCSSRPQSVYSFIGPYYDCQTDTSNMTERKATSSSKLDPCLVESDDPKIQTLLDAFINRARKAQSDLKQINLTPNRSSPRQPQENYSDEPSIQNRQLFTPTKLIFFKNGRDLSISESIQEVRRFLNK